MKRRRPSWLPWSMFRWLLAAAALPVLIACTDHVLVPPDPRPSVVSNQVTLVNPPRQLDVVFMIDNSLSMGDEQAKLIRSFPLFMQALTKASPPGTLDVHIGVISSDLGGCSGGDGDGGALQHRALGNDGACTAIPRGSFIQLGPQGKNFDGSIEDVFSCIAPLGTKGCGFEHQLGSLRRALGGDPAAPMPADNAGFLRPDARLGIVLITDEDDCTAPADTDLFEGATNRYGPRQSYRCNQFGHLCGGNPPPRTADTTLADCTSNETASSKLTHVDDFVTFLRGLKSNPDNLKVAVITGPATPYRTRLVTPERGEAYVDIAPACRAANDTAGAGESTGASPAVRLHQFADAFGAKNGITRSICADDFTDVMTAIGEAFGTVPTCIGARLADTDPATPGVQRQCVVVETPPSGDAASSRVLPRCQDHPGQTPCWSLVVDSVACPTSQAPESLQVMIDRGGASPPVGGYLTTSCVICAGPHDPNCPVP